MLRSSLGFHTMTLSLFLTEYEMNQLLNDFIEYNEKTGFLLMGYIVDVIINPKTLSDIHDYITAATYCDMKMAIICFNNEMAKISPLLKTFYDYNIKRIDYCINFYLKELAPECSQEQIINLLRRGDIPPSYQEWTEYDERAHRDKRKPESFYLYNSSVTINCYSKYMQLINQSRKNQKKGYAPISPNILEAAQDIIRFEVQCKYPKTFSLNQKAELLGNHNLNKYKTLLGHDFYNEEIHYYYNKVIGKGDWYSMQEAIRIIQSKHFNSQKEKRFIDNLHLIGRHHNIATAKSLLQGRELESFKHTLNELSALNINPVTIPKRWNIEHIPNLLYTYYQKARIAELEPLLG